MMLTAAVTALLPAAALLSSALTAPATGASLPTLAQAFNNVYLDGGLSINYLGARAPAFIARLLEMAPFRKILYSSDGFGPAELHYLGALLWRRGIHRVLGGFVDVGDWSEADATRVVDLVARKNAARLYRLDTT